MSINKFLDQTISIKLIIVGGGFWLIVAVFVVYFMFGGIKEGFNAGLVGIGSAIDYKMGDGVKTNIISKFFFINLGIPKNNELKKKLI